MGSQIGILRGSKYQYIEQRLQNIVKHKDMKPVAIVEFLFGGGGEELFRVLERVQAGRNGCCRVFEKAMRLRRFVDVGSVLLCACETYKRNTCSADTAE